MGEWRMREIGTGPEDARFLCEMLFAASAWRPSSPPPTVEEAHDMRIRKLYVEGWGRTGDVGVIAHDEDEQPLGASWYRLFTEAQHGYGFIDPSIPELALAVKHDTRGLGVGTALLRALISHARAEGCSALSLSVEQDNRAVHLYERTGFVRVDRVGNSWTMRLDVRADSVTRCRSRWCSGRR